MTLYKDIDISADTLLINSLFRLSNSVLFYIYFLYILAKLYKQYFIINK